MLVQVQRLTHIYAPRTPLERTALQGIDLEIPPGQRMGIIGSTGSGKSTLVQLFVGLLKPTVGQVLLDGVPAHRGSRSARARRRRIGLAFQYPEDQIFEQTVYQEVAFGLTQHNKMPGNQLTVDQQRARVQWALAQVGLTAEEMAERPPLTLSGGEMRRVALASALCTRPEILILDEPTAGLDPQGRRTLLSSIQSWRAHSPNQTLIIISHNLDDLSRLVDRVIVLVQGRVVADGPARQTLSDPALLHAAGLEPPPSVALLHALHQAGWSVRTDILAPQNAAQEIAREYKSRERL